MSGSLEWIFENVVLIFDRFISEMSSVNLNRARPINPDMEVRIHESALL